MNKLVLITFSIFILAMGAFLVYRNLPQAGECPEQPITISNRSPFVGEEVSFSYGQDLRRYRWDFGDESKKSRQKEVQHIYAEEGDYIVRLVINRHCILEDTISVVEKLEPAVKFLPGKIKAPEKARVGQSVTFECTQTEAENIHWRFDESEDYPEGARVSHSFSNGGEYQVKAYWSEGGKQFESEHTIMIVEARPGPGCRSISIQDFRNKLNNVSAASISDFRGYFLNGNTNITVEAISPDGSKREYSFFVYYQELKDKQTKIASVELSRANSNCITRIKIREQ